MDANITPKSNEHTGLVTLGIIVLLLIIGIIYNLYNPVRNYLCKYPKFKGYDNNKQF